MGKAYCTPPTHIYPSVSGVCEKDDKREKREIGGGWYSRGI